MAVRSAFVYVGQVASGPVKIGLTRKRPACRMQELRFGDERPSLVLSLERPTYRAARVLELELHERFIHATLAPEWFRPIPEIDSFVRAHGGEGIAGVLPGASCSDFSTAELKTSPLALEALRRTRKQSHLVAGYGEAWRRIDLLRELSRLPGGW